MKIATAKNIESLMDKEKMNYFGPSHPLILVKKLTKEIITEAIEAYAEDNPYWFKWYHFADEIDPAVFDKLQNKNIEYLRELEKLAGLEDL